MVDQPIDVVWPAALALRASEIRLFGPLMALRHVPQHLTGRDAPMGGEIEASFVEQFEQGGFSTFRHDDKPVDGRAAVIQGAAGRFWSPIGNTPRSLGDADEFLACVEPNLAKTAFILEAVAHGDRTELITETRVAGTDRSSTRKFGVYWAIIRGPSGLIRRSWLAAIDRRAQHKASADPQSAVLLSHRPKSRR